MERKNKNQLYSICKSKITEEYHIFLSRSDEDKNCYFMGNESICGSMTTEDKGSCAEVCGTILRIRKKSADLGDVVCGNCMKSIYKT